MKISPIIYNKHIANNTKIKNATIAQPIFKGKRYPSGYYNDKEIEYAKKYLGQEDWEESYINARYDEIYPLSEEKERIIDNIDSFLNKHENLGMLTFALVFPNLIINVTLRMNRVKRITQPEIKRLRLLMADLNNEHLEELKKERIEIECKEKIENRKKNIHDAITNNFLQSLMTSKTDDSIKVPTVVMISGGIQSERDEAIDWVKKQIDSRVVPIDLPEDENDALYRIETEIDYAQEYYEKNKIRSVLFINNFDRILNSRNVSSKTIGDLKELLSDLSIYNTPLTIVFQAKDVQNIDNAFISNDKRIPCNIDLDKIETTASN